MQKFTMINVYNKSVKVFMTEEEYSEKFESVTNTIEYSMEYGDESGIAEGFRWEILDSRIVKINNTLFNIDSSLLSFEINNLLIESNHNIDIFKDKISDKYYIEEVFYETFANDSAVTKTILLQDDKLIDKSAYTVSLNLKDTKIEEIIRNTNELLLYISKNNLDELKLFINKFPFDITIDNFKLGGDFIDDWHSLFTILLKEYGLNYQITEATIFNH